MQQDGQDWEKEKREEDGDAYKIGQLLPTPRVCCCSWNKAPNPAALGPLSPLLHGDQGPCSHLLPVGCCSLFEEVRSHFSPLSLPSSALSEVQPLLDSVPATAAYGWKQQQQEIAAAQACSSSLGIPGCKVWVCNINLLVYEAFPFLSQRKPKPSMPDGIACLIFNRGPG